MEKPAARPYLPIDPYLPEALRLLDEAGALVLRAPPGAGKTTRLPPAVADAEFLKGKKIALLEPRRIAARAAARRMAGERGQAVGEEVGFQVRFDVRLSARTRIVVATEGVLLARMQEDPFLEGFGCVILDEFHERSLPTDLALAWVREIRQGPRPDLRLVVMSATFEVEPLRAFLAGCPVLDVPAPRHPVEICYLARPDRRSIAVRAAAGAARALAENRSGDLLVFLPGIAEIRETARLLQGIAAAQDLRVLPLHGDLSAAEQDAAITPQSRRKVVLSTNLAETSLTVEGVAHVVDAGYARVPVQDERTGLDRLVLRRVSKASAEQRAGRAGRQGPGRAYRLWTEVEHASLPEAEVPEILRVDLAGPMLEVAAWGAADLEAFPFYEAPPRARIGRARDLLARLGALDEKTGRITDAGRRMRRIPAHPRLARMLLEAAQRGCLQEGALAAAVLSERDPLRGPPGRGAVSAPADLLIRLERLRDAERAGLDGAAARAAGIDGAALRTVRQAAGQLERLVRQGGGAPRRATDDAEKERGLRQALLEGFPDRVARRKEPKGETFVLAEGGTAKMPVFSANAEPEWIAALLVEGGSTAERKGGLIRLACRIEPSWLEDFFPGVVRVEEIFGFDEGADRVTGVRRRRFGSLTLEESALPFPDAAAASEELARAARTRLDRALGLDEEAVQSLLGRIAFLREAMPELGLPEVGAEDWKALLPRICQGRRSFEETRKVALVPFVKERLPPGGLEALGRHAPEAIPLPSGRRGRLVYEKGRKPRLSVRLQELFGLTETPRVAAGRVPVLLDLLGPNFRTVQRTENLESFWKNTYPRVRKDLRARYPKHAWPEDPLDPRGGKPGASSPRRRPRPR